MQLDIKQLLPQHFADTSRVWIYQSNRLFTLTEAFEIEDILKSFIENWSAHGSAVKGYANLFFGQFIVVMADETQTQVSGCSTDSSVRMIKQMEERFKVSMFDRQTLAFSIKDKVQLLPLSQLQYAVENNFITPDTLYLNNLVATKADLENNWIIPIKQSWLAKKLNLQQA